MSRFTERKICKAMIETEACVLNAVARLHTVYHAGHLLPDNDVQHHLSDARNQLAKALAAVDAAMVIDAPRLVAAE